MAHSLTQVSMRLSIYTLVCFIFQRHWIPCRNLSLFLSLQIFLSCIQSKSFLLPKQIFIIFIKFSWISQITANQEKIKRLINIIWYYELQWLSCSPERLQRDLHPPSLYPVDRISGSSRPRHRLCSQILRPCWSHVIHLLRTGISVSWYLT